MTITHRRRILVLDDDKLVCKAIQRVLRSRYDVVTATLATEAIRLLDGGAEFDVIVCDIEMPEMGGHELHDFLARTRPAIARRMVFATGGAFTAEGRRFVAAEAHRVLAKPFTVGELRALVAHALAAGSP